MLTRALCACLSAWVCAGLIGCSDDDPQVSDAGMDAGMDSGPIFIPRRDASVAPTDPIRECNRFQPDSCPSGQVCDVIVRLFEGEQQLAIYTGCVEQGRERGLGDPCDPDYTNGVPYNAEGLTDLVFRDPCGPGLICASDPDIRGGTSCQPSCFAGSQSQAAVLCEDPGSYCIDYPNDPVRDFCRPSDDCDVAAQTGCPEGQNCYLRVRDDSAGFLTMCLPPHTMTVADGRPCLRYNECRPGSSCNGPIRKALSTWTEEDIICRPACGEDGSLFGGDADADAGADDAGAGDGTCSGPRSCAAFSASGLDLSELTNPPYGQCE